MNDSVERALPELAELTLTGNPIANNSVQLAQIMSVKFPHIEKNAAKLRQCKSPYLMLSNQIFQAGAKSADPVSKTTTAAAPQNHPSTKKLSLGQPPSIEAVAPNKEASNAIAAPSPSKSICVLPENAVPIGKSGHTAAKRKAQENAVIKII